MVCFSLSIGKILTSEQTSYSQKNDLKFLPEVIDGLEEVVVRYERQVVEDGEVIIVVGSSRVNTDKSYVFVTAVVVGAVVINAVVVTAVVFAVVVVAAAAVVTSVNVSAVVGAACIVSAVVAATFIVTAVVNTSDIGSAVVIAAVVVI